MDWNSTAEKTNIPWREMTIEILESDVYKEMESIENPSVVYPDCNFLNSSNSYLFPFLYWSFLMFPFSLWRKSRESILFDDMDFYCILSNWLHNYFLQITGLIKMVLDIFKKTS